MRYRKFKMVMKTMVLLFLSILLSEENQAFSQAPGTTFYWIGDGGDWTDVNHWSLTSGGAAGAVLPGQDDAVVFDDNSFTIPNQDVLINDDGSFYSMDWSGITEDQSLLFDSTLYAHGNVTLNKKLSILRNVNFSGIQFIKQAIFNADSASIDCAFTIIMDAVEDSLILADDLIMSDSSSCILFTGKLSTQGHTLKTGSLKSINNPLSGLDLRSIDISNSTLYLSLEFNSAGDTSLVFNADNSTIHIGDTLDYLNNLKTQDLNFNDVYLNFKPLTTLQIIEGNNTFNKLTVLPGSRVHLYEGSTQTVADSLVLNGNCKDMITIASSDTSSTANTASLIKLNSNLDFIGLGLQIKQINSLPGEILTTYHSIDNGGNDLGWVFDPTSSITSDFTANGPFCFGDTTLFSNTSSTTGTINYSWQYNDDSYLESPGGLIEAHNDTTFNFPQAPGIDTTSYGQILAWTEITDGQSLFSPVSGGATTVQGYESMNYNFTVAYRMELINGTGSDAYLVDMDEDPALASYDYQPRIKIYKNGIDFAANLATSSVFDEHVFYEDTLPNGSMQIGADTVSFNVSAFNLLPTDSLTIYFGSDVTYTAVTNQPRWKSTVDILGTDVSIDYQLIIDSVYFEATPVTSSFNLDTTQHFFQSNGDFNVSLIAINDDNFCTDTTTQLIHINQPTVYLSTSEPDTTICIGDEVTFETFSTITGVQFEYFYNGVSQNTPSINDTLFVTSTLSNLDTMSVLAYENGCISDTMPQYVFVVNGLPNYTFVSDDFDASICSGDSVLFTASSPDLSYDYSFLLDGLGVTPVSDTIGYYNTAGLLDNEIISAVVVDDNGCSDTSSITFNVNPLPIVSLSESTGGNVICGNQQVTFTGSGADQYQFLINGSSVQGPLSNTDYLNSSLTANDTISLIGQSNFGCSQQALQIFNYIVNPAPNTQVSSSDLDNTICSNEQIIYTASGAGLYQFFLDGNSVQGPGTNNIYLGSGLNNNATLSVLGSLGGCNQMSSDIVTTVLQAPMTVLVNNDDGDNAICAGTSVEFSASGAANYEFFIDGISQGSSSAQNTFQTSGLQNNQVVMVQGESNSCIISDQESFNVLVNPIVDLFSNDIDNVLCEQDPVTITGVNASEYAFWVNGAVFQPLSNDNTLSNPTLPIGSDTIVVQGVSANGCDDYSDPIVVTVNAIPNIVVTGSDFDNEICQGDSVSFVASGGDSYQFYLNGVPQGPVSPDTEFTTIGINDGESVLVEASLLGCNSTSNLITFQVNPVPNVGIISTDVDNIFCAGDEVTYTATGADVYQFFVGGVAHNTPSSNNEMNSLDFTTGSYELMVVGESQGCSDDDVINILVNELPNAGITSSDTDNSICSGQNVVFTASGGNTYLFYNGSIPQGVPSFNNQYISTDLVQGSEISVLVITSQGCTDSIGSGAFTVFESPSITLSSSVIFPSICSGDNVEFSAVGAPEFEYFIDGQSLGSSSNPTINIDSLENAEPVFVLGTSTQGCTDTSNVISFNVFQSPVVNLVNYDDSTLCVDELSNLEAFGADLYQFYLNGIPVGGFDSNANFNQVLNNLDLISVQGSSNGCQSPLTSDLQFAVFDYPVLTSSSSDADNIVCAQDTVEITAAGGQNFNFLLNGQLMQSGTINLYEAFLIQNNDLIEVIALNGTCASDTMAYLFAVNEMDLDLSILPSNIICEGESVTLSASGGNEYQFSINGQSIGSFENNDVLENVSVNDLDEFGFNAFNTSTGCYQTYGDYIIVTVQETPEISPEGPISVCEGDSVLLISNYPYGNQWYVDGAIIDGAIDTLLYASNSGSYYFTGTYGGQGDVWSIGQNASGIHGNGDNFNSSNPQRADYSTAFTSIYSGVGFMTAVDELNQVFTWGENNTGQLGNGTFTSSNIPIETPGLDNIQSCAASKSSVMAVGSLGNVFVWGGNTEGELGIGSASVVNFPMAHPSLSNVDTISAGQDHFIILKNDGTVWSVGNNEFGQLGIGSTINQTEPILISELSNIENIGTGDRHSFAIDSNGVLFAWGNNSSGQLGTGDLNAHVSPEIINISSIISVDGGAAHSLFLKETGEVYSCGGNDFGQLGNLNANPLIPSKIAISGVRQISAGKNTSLFSRNDLSVFGCGNNNENQITGEISSQYLTPIHMVHIHGANVINASETSSHFIYNAFNSCQSNDLELNVLNVPNAVISFAGEDTLITEVASGYQWFLDGNLIPDANLQYYVPETSGNYSVELTSANGCSSLSDPVSFGIGSVTGLVDSQVSIYPNPAQNHLYVSTNAPGSLCNIVIRDQIGKLVHQSFSMDELKIIDISQLRTGNYFISITESTHTHTYRFTKISKD